MLRFVKSSRYYANGLINYKFYLPYETSQSYSRTINKPVACCWSFHDLQYKFLLGSLVNIWFNKSYTCLSSNDTANYMPIAASTKTLRSTFDTGHHDNKPIWRSRAANAIRSRHHRCCFIAEFYGWTRSVQSLLLALGLITNWTIPITDWCSLKEQTPHINIIPGIKRIYNHLKHIMHDWCRFKTALNTIHLQITVNVKHWYGNGSTMQTHLEEM